MVTAVIPGRDTSPVLQPAECISNKMPPLIPRFTKGKCYISGPSGGMQTVVPLAFRDSRSQLAS